MKVLLVLALVVFVLAGAPTCGNAFNAPGEESVLAMEDDFVTSLDFAVSLAESENGKSCKDKLICEYPCEKCPAEPYLYDLTPLPVMKEPYANTCTRPKQNIVHDIIKVRLDEFKESKAGLHHILYNETQQQLYAFAKTVSRLCDDKMIPRATPVEVINNLWDEFIRKSPAIQNFIGLIGGQIGDEIALDQMRKIGYLVLNEVVDVYTRPCLCTKIINAADADAKKKGILGLVDVAKYQIIETGIIGRCQLAVCKFKEGAIQIKTPFGVITVNLPMGVYAVRDEQGARDIGGKGTTVVIDRNDGRKGHKNDDDNGRGRDDNGRGRDDKNGKMGEKGKDGNIGKGINGNRHGANSDKGNNGNAWGKQPNKGPSRNAGPSARPSARPSPRPAGENRPTPNRNAEGPRIWIKKGR